MTAVDDLLEPCAAGFVVGLGRGAVYLLVGGGSADGPRRHCLCVG